MHDEGPPQTVTVDRGTKQGVAFGLECLSGGLNRQASVNAVELCELVVFSTKDIQLDEDRLQRLADRIFVDTAATALRATPVFMDLLASQLEPVASLFQFESFTPGQPFFVEGGACDRLFILLNGSVSVTKCGKNVANLDASIGESLSGHPFFGVAGLLEPDARRPYDVTSRTPSSALVLTMQGFKRFLKSVPDFKERLQEFSDMRRRAWELECGLDLDVGQSIPGAESSPVNRLEAALLVQAGIRSMLARRKWTSKKELQDLHSVEEAEAASPAVQYR